ncbi:unnamed protein product [Paramecium pentaurelia]|uniref:Transmembrane protein n=1 Tax=Paramecium pentaurelia TaxID=43138 RepID=A0A8S1WMH9_9CILI|nr:unnamed protein product [Paramecium pentaurelia]
MIVPKLQNVTEIMGLAYNFNFQIQFNTKYVLPKQGVIGTTVSVTYLMVNALLYQERIKLNVCNKMYIALVVIELIALLKILITVKQILKIHPVLHLLEGMEHVIGIIQPINAWLSILAINYHNLHPKQDLYLVIGMLHYVQLQLVFNKCTFVMKLSSQNYIQVCQLQNNVCTQITDVLSLSYPHKIKQQYGFHNLQIMEVFVILVLLIRFLLTIFQQVNIINMLIQKILLNGLLIYYKFKKSNLLFYISYRAIVIMPQVNIVFEYITYVPNNLVHKFLAIKFVHKQ